MILLLLALACSGDDTGAVTVSTTGTVGGTLPTLTTTTGGGNERTDLPPIVFVSRAIQQEGSIYFEEANGMPGVGGYSRFRTDGPGRLLLRDADGKLKVLVDGTTPSTATLDLYDVNAPSVSWDGQTIVFAGITRDFALAPDTEPEEAHPGGWRIYSVGVDGTNLRKLTDEHVPISLIGGHDDTDPVFLPDGRIVFSSTRWPGYAQYGINRTTNLFVMDDDGGDLHRITAERNGGDRPIIEPDTGRIVYSRWWRNVRYAAEDPEAVEYLNGTNARDGYVTYQGLTIDRQDQAGGVDAMERNQWHLAAIHPDGTGLQQWTGTHHKYDDNSCYGGTFVGGDAVLCMYFPLKSLSETSGFGGLRRYEEGFYEYEGVVGVVDSNGDLVRTEPPQSVGTFVGPYYAEPHAMEDGRLLVSMAPDHLQDYGLYTMNPDGTGLELVLDLVGVTDLRAVAVESRPVPPVIADTVHDVAHTFPPAGDAANVAIDGTFTFHDLNVYGNGPVDMNIISAPKVGSVSAIRFFYDHQTSPTSADGQFNFPRLLGEASVSPAGELIDAAAPANLPLFEQLRGPDGSVPVLGGPDPDGVAHVAGMNFGRPGAEARCVGCHAGHSMIPVPADDDDARFSNLAPGATITVSNSRDPRFDDGLIDRMVMTGDNHFYWSSGPNKQDGQWVELTFPVPVSVREVVLYNPRPGDESKSTIEVKKATVKLYDGAGNQVKASGVATDVVVDGTGVPFDDVRATRVRVEFDSVTGDFYNTKQAALAEVEVIARGEAP